MDSIPKPIETTYNGYRFRSRLEARWAVFFDMLGIKYEYEKEGFELGNGVRYLPDFWLPQMETWIEIKGPAISDADKEKPARLALMQESPVVLISGSPWPGEHTVERFRDNRPHDRLLWYVQQAVERKDWWLISLLYQEMPRLYWGDVADLLNKVPDAPAIFANRALNKFYITARHVWIVCPKCWATRLEPEDARTCPDCGAELDPNDADLLAAFGAARSARFEHGESGVR